MYWDKFWYPVKAVTLKYYAVDLSNKMLYKQNNEHHKHAESLNNYKQEAIFLQ